MNSTDLTEEKELKNLIDCGGNEANHNHNHESQAGEQEQDIDEETDSCHRPLLHSSTRISYETVLLKIQSIRLRVSQLFASLSLALSNSSFALSTTSSFSSRISTARTPSEQISFRIQHILQSSFHSVSLSIALVLLIFLPLHTFHAITRDHHNHQGRPDEVAFTSAAVFVVITLVLSINLIYHHFSHWYMPDVQKYVVRILFMVPIYSIQSWLSLRFHQARIYIDTLRDLYEAFVIQSFLYYLIELLGGEDGLIMILQNKNPSYGHHQSIFRFFFQPWTMGQDFALHCKHGVLQYVLVKTCATLVTALLEPLQLYGEGQFVGSKGYPYISFCINLSQMWALYCLIKFYHATHNDLRHPINWHPLRKFLCIKGVVFFTWWQGVAIAYLKSRGIIREVGSWDKNDVANGIQNYLICTEMFCFAIAHIISFSYIECLPSSHVQRQGHSIHDSQIQIIKEEYKEEDVTNGCLDSESLLVTKDDSHTLYQPPKIRTLDTPGLISDAFWSSTVPRDTFKEVKRFTRHGVALSKNVDLS